MNEIWDFLGEGDSCNALALQSQLKAINYA